MKTVRIKFRALKESVIVCRKHVLSSQLFGELPRLKRDGAILFTDSNVYALYKRQIGRYLTGIEVHVMEAGEENKNEKTLFSLLNAMAEAGLRRNSTLIALGGGVVGDIGGLAASLYMRGISCIQVPTTLLAQVDSSVGGKTAIDFCGVKNLVGAFHQPSAVYVDPAFFRTLPEREIRCGLGEIVKHGALCAPLFAALCENRDRLTDPAFLAGIVPDNIAFKAEIVRRDPHETGLRRCLNLGHTTAHAIELSSSLSHGECVLWGLILEGKLAMRHLETDGGFLETLFALCKTVLGEGEIPSPGGLESALLDKKNTEADSVTLTVPVAPETYELLRLPFSEYESELHAILEEL